MAQLTLEKAKELLKKLQYAKAQMGQLSLNDEMYKQALEKLIPMWEGEQQAIGSFEWIGWGGGLRPCGNDSTIDIRMRDGTEIKNTRAGFWVWTSSMDEDDIIAYRLVKP